MLDPVTGALEAVVVSKTLALGKRIYDEVNGARSSVKMDSAVAEVEAESREERRRRQEAEAIGAALTRSLLEIKQLHKWEGEPQDEQPTEHDFASAAVDLIRQARRAGSNRKREVLFHAFHMQFSPEFYKTGMGRLLWSIACELEYPTMRALKDIEELATVRPNQQYLGRCAMIVHSHELWPHVARLERPGLLVAVRETTSDRVVVSALGHAFIRFALDEYRDRGDRSGE